MKPAIELEGLSKLYRLGLAGREKLWALKEVSFSVRRGETLGIIGKNGAGKTTLLKILSKITAPTAGRAVVRGRVSTLLQVGAGFHPRLTGRENVYLNGAIHGMRMRQITAKFDEIAAFSGVERFMDMPVKHYSSGMAMRLGFAVAAHLEPDILLLDESLSMGDIDFEKRCAIKLLQINQNGGSILLVSHDVKAARLLCGRAAVLQKGSLVCIGDVETAIAHYLDLKSNGVPARVC